MRGSPSVRQNCLGQIGIQWKSAFGGRSLRFLNLALVDTSLDFQSEALEIYIMPTDPRHPSG